MSGFVGVTRNNDGSLLEEDMFSSENSSLCGMEEYLNEGPEAIYFKKMLEMSPRISNPAVRRARYTFGSLTQSVVIDYVEYPLVQYGCPKPIDHPPVIDLSIDDECQEVVTKDVMVSDIVTQATTYLGRVVYNTLTAYFVQFIDYLLEVPKQNIKIGVQDGNGKIPMYHSLRVYPSVEEIKNVLEGLAGMPCNGEIVYQSKHGVRMDLQEAVIQQIHDGSIYELDVSNPATWNLICIYSAFRLRY